MTATFTLDIIIQTTEIVTFTLDAYITSKATCTIDAYIATTVEIIIPECVPTEYFRRCLRFH